MKLVILPSARQSIKEAAAFVEGMNTIGSGDRWIDKIYDFIAHYAQDNVKYALCNYEPYAAKGFSCISFNNWVIVFKIDSGEFIVHEFIYGSVLP